jgi:pimeloyl-ACP methyl ester carboxylesterase
MQQTSVDQGGNLKKVRTAVAEIYYLENGPTDGSPVFLLHGFPDDRSSVAAEPLCYGTRSITFLWNVHRYGTSRVHRARMCLTTKLF